MIQKQRHRIAAAAEMKSGGTTINEEEEEGEVEVSPKAGMEPKALV